MNFDFSTPYSSARLPQFARNIVSTSHPLAAQAGLRMMLKGGNAVDAAIAAAAAITITEPVSNGLGSDAFCILWDGQKLHGLNASGHRPGRPNTFTTSMAKRLSIRLSEVGTLSRYQAPWVHGRP
jgi:gamma-glutamyltranspeptidase/glutathione hydrolase